MEPTKNSVVPILMQQTSFMYLHTVFHSELVEEHIITTRQQRDIRNYILQKCDEFDKRSEDKKQDKTVEETKPTKLFFDTEFTGLHQHTTLISIGIVAENGFSFYAELTDYNIAQVDEWCQVNVIENLKYNHLSEGSHKHGWTWECKGDTFYVRKILCKWLEKFGNVEMWSDCLAYDSVLFNQIFGHAFELPKNVFYIPFDIATLFKIKGIDPDIDRYKFAGMQEDDKHNALADAQIIKRCYEILEKMK